MEAVVGRAVVVGAGRAVRLVKVRAVTVRVVVLVVATAVVAAVMALVDGVAAAIAPRALSVRGSASSPS
jgi:hypothetical protein